MTKTRPDTASEPQPVRRVTMSRVVLVAFGMLMMLLLQAFFWPGHGLVWRKAARLPNVMVKIARPASAHPQLGCCAGSATTSTRIKAANAAAFVPTLINAVTGVGAP